MLLKRRPHPPSRRVLAMLDRRKLEEEMELICNEGDLALVIYDEPGCEENIGKVVHVSGPVEVNRELQLPCWLIQPVHSNLWRVRTVRGKLVTESVTWESRVEHPDAWLIPLRPQTPESVWWEMQEEIDRALLEMGVIQSVIQPTS